MPCEKTNMFLLSEALVDGNANVDKDDIEWYFMIPIREAI